MTAKELIQKYFDASLSGSEVKKLRVLLKNDGGLLKEFLFEAHMENAVEMCFEEENAEDAIKFPEEIYDGELTEEDLRNVSAAGIFTPPEHEQ